MINFNNKTVLITGGTGSFGRAFLKYALSFFPDVSVIVYSRDEMKQWDLSFEYEKDERVRFLLGDVRDFARLSEAFRGVDYVVHAAAVKIVPLAEYNPRECISTNIDGSLNVIKAAIENEVEAVVALSTDKASSPINLYGASKLVSDKLFVAANYQNSHGTTRFGVVRYGNVMGSRGSVIPFFLSLKSNKLPITDPAMTRFMISLNQAVDLVICAFDTMLGGEIFVKKIPSMRLTDIAEAVRPDCDLNIIGLRPGEKKHEQMIAAEESESTYEYPEYYKILPDIYGWNNDIARIGKGVKVPSGFRYSSENNESWMSVADLRKWIETELPRASEPRI